VLGVRIQKSKFKVHSSKYEGMVNKFSVFNFQLSTFFLASAGEFGDNVEQDTDERVENVDEEDMRDNVFFFQFGSGKTENQILAQGFEHKD
jgi:hypothetical protein